MNTNNGCPLVWPGWLEQAQGHDARGWGLNTRPPQSLPKTMPSLPNFGGQAAALETRSLDEGKKRRGVNCVIYLVSKYWQK